MRSSRRSARCNQHIVRTLVLALPLLALVTALGLLNAPNGVPVALAANQCGPSSSLQNGGQGQTTETATAASGQVINQVWVVSGNDAAGQRCTQFTYLPGVQTDARACYSVSGLGTNKVSVTKVGGDIASNGTKCQGISHLEYVQSTPTQVTQTLAGHIYACNTGATTTTEVSGGTLSASGPQTISAVANPLAPTQAAAGTYTMTATAPTGDILVICGDGQTSASSQSAIVSAGGAGTGIFYVTSAAVTPNIGVFFGYADSCLTPSNLNDAYNCKHASPANGGPRQFPTPFYNGTSAWSTVVPAYPADLSAAPAAAICASTSCYAGCWLTTGVCDLDGSTIRIHNSSSSAVTITNFQISFPSAVHSCVFTEIGFWHLTSVTVLAGGDLIFAPTGHGGTINDCQSDLGSSAGTMDGSDYGALDTTQFYSNGGTNPNFDWPAIWTNDCNNSGLIPIVTFTASIGGTSIPVHIADTDQVLNTFGVDIGGVSSSGWQYTYGVNNQVWQSNPSTNQEYLNTGTYTGFYCPSSGVVSGAVMSGFDFGPASNESIAWVAESPN